MIRSDYLYSDTKHIAVAMMRDLEAGLFGKSVTESHTWDDDTARLACQAMLGIIGKRSPRFYATALEDGFDATFGRGKIEYARHRVENVNRGTVVWHIAESSTRRIQFIDMANCSWSDLLCGWLMQERGRDDRKAWAELNHDFTIGYDFEPRLR